MTNVQQKLKVPIHSVTYQGLGLPIFCKSLAGVYYYKVVSPTRAIQVELPTNEDQEASISISKPSTAFMSGYTLITEGEFLIQHSKVIMQMDRVLNEGGAE